MVVNSIGVNVSCNRYDYSLKVSDEKPVKVTDNSSVDIQQKTEDAVVDKVKLKSAVDLSNKVLFKNNTHLKFEIHEKTRDVMVTIIDDESGEVVKEIPPKKILDLAASLMEIAGILVDERR